MSTYGKAIAAAESTFADMLQSVIYGNNPDAMLTRSAPDTIEWEAADGWVMCIDVRMKTAPRFIAEVITEDDLSPAQLAMVRSGKMTLIEAGTNI